MDADERVARSAPGDPPQVGGPHLVERDHGGADHDEDRAATVPAERGQPGSQRPVAALALAPQERVHDERLEPGVPRPTHLGGTGVDLGGRERDLARVTQDGLAQVALGARDRQLVRVLLDHLDADPDELERVLQGDRACELGRGSGEDLVGAVRGSVGGREPLRERGDRRLGEQADPGPLLCREPAVPLELRLHAAQGGAREEAAGVLDALQVVGAPGRRHG